MVTPDAMVILLVLQMQWESMTVIAHELLARRILSCTVEERYRAPLDQPPSGLYGLGGLVGRIAAEVVPDIRVLEGPAVGDGVVGFQDNKVYIDNLVLELSLDVVTGIYHVRVVQECANQVALKSFWLRHSTFIKSEIYCSQWLPDAKTFYQDRVDVLQSEEKCNLLTSLEWHLKMKNKNNNPQILAGSARLAVDFVCNKIL